MVLSSYLCFYYCVYYFILIPATAEDFFYFIALLMLLLLLLFFTIGWPKTPAREKVCAVLGAYVAIFYVLSLRGSEGFMINLSTINAELKNEQDFCLIGLKGKAKGETAERDHIFPCIKMTKSRIDILAWLKMLSLVHAMAGRSGGPAITSWKGNILSTSHLDGLLHYYLIDLHQSKEEFPFEIKSEDDICERFSVFRSLRRASTTRAINQGASQVDIDVMNRWQAVEASKGKGPSRAMRQHCAEVNLLKGPFLCHTGAM